MSSFLRSLGLLSNPTRPVDRTPLVSLPPLPTFASPFPSTTIPTGKPFEKLLRQEEKAGSKDGKMSRPTKDVGGWAASTSTSYDDDDTVRTVTKDAAHEVAADLDSSAAGEMDWTRLGEILKRGRTKDRIHELNKIESIASKGGQYTLAESTRYLAHAQSLPSALGLALDIPATHILPLTALLPSLTPRYNDVPSNEAVVNALSALVKADSEGKGAEQWKKWILKELARCFPASGQ